MRKHRICILLNNMLDFEFEELLDSYLPCDRFDVLLTDVFPENHSSYDLIVPWNYQNIIKNAELINNIIVFHASNLPEGRGWAPIYYTFSEKRAEYVVSGILAADKVDTGDIVIRASFAMKDEYTAQFIRKIDNELTLLLISKIINKWPEGGIKGQRQIGAGSYRNRRYSCDNEIDIHDAFSDLIPHLRGVERSSPAFFYVNDIKYIIEIYPDVTPGFPSDIKIEYPVLGEFEIWNR